MKNILVIGATGFIGSNLVTRLVEDRENNVYVLVRPNSRNGKTKLSEIKGLFFIYCEISGLISEKLPQFDICYNLAAYGVDYSEQNVEKMIDVNIKLLISLIDFVEFNKTKLFINTGSCFEYGETEGKEKINEDTKLNPQGLYGATKAAATIIGNVYAKNKKINMITVRPFGIYGIKEGQHKLIPKLIKSALKNEQLDMTGAEQIRDYLYVDDLVDAYIKLSISDKIVNYQVYNVCSGNAIKIKDFVDSIVDITSCNKELFKLGALKYRNNEVMYFVGDNSKILNVTNWYPKTDIFQGLNKTIEFYKDLSNEQN